MDKILVVDDEPEIVNTLEEFLTKRGFGVITASDGSQAVEIINSGDEIDLVLLDIKMPKMQGVDVLKKINRQIPVIVLTGSVDEKYAEEVRDMGYGNVDVLSKPIDLYLLLNSIKRKFARDNAED